MTYAFEPVPTDVEVGRDGSLYVTTLPGGPESRGSGARGTLWKVTRRPDGTRGGFGLPGATNLALGKHGEVYVSEFFAGEISVVRNGRVRPYLTLPGVVAVETSASGELWAGTIGGPSGPGTIVKISNGKAYRQASLRR